MTAERSFSSAQRFEAVEPEDLQRQLELELGYSKALEGLLIALRECTSFDQLLPRLLQVLAEVTTAASAVLWLREGNKLRCRAVVGSADASDTSSSVAFAGVFGEQSAAELNGKVISVSSEHPLCGGLGLDGGEGLCLPLISGEALAGVVCLALPKATKLEAQQRERLAALAQHAATAVGEQLARDDLARSL